MEEALKALLNEQTQVAYTSLDRIRHEHDIPPIIHNMALCLELESKFEQAADLYRSNISRHPDYARSYVGLANCLRHMRDFKESRRILHEAVELFPAFPQTYFLLSSAYARANDMDTSARFLVAGCLVARDMNARDTTHFIQAYYDDLCGTMYTMRKGAATLLDLLYAESIPQELVLDMHRWMGTTRDPPRAPCPTDNKVLRIGYISRAFRSGSLASVFLPIVQGHTDAFDVYCYHMGTVEDETTEIIKACSKFRACPKSPRQALDCIQDDHIDILVSLDGQTSNAVMHVMEARPAPVSIDMLGYPFSTGLESIDYKLVDMHTDPPGSESLYTESLARMPCCFLAWQPPVQRPVSQARDGPIRLYSPNNFKKLSRGFVQILNQILDRAPDAHVYFKSSIHETGDDVGEFFDTNLASHRNRVHFVKYKDTTQDHYAELGSYDIVLDPFPYNGTVTTLESLYCGVPVVTLAGDAHRSRVGSSILYAIGHPELVAPTTQAYIDLVLDLIRDRELLEHYHATLHDDLAQSTIMKYDAYIQAYENLILKIWETSVGSA